MGTKTLMTIEQFAQLETADTEKYELVEGELIPLSSGTPRHARIRRAVEYTIQRYFEGNPIGEILDQTDFRISAETVRCPDLSIVLGAHVAAIDPDKIPVPFAPDIAIQVLSPSESAMDVRRKVRGYLRAGTLEVWLIDHANAELEIHTNAGIRLLQQTDVLESPVLPGFRALVADLLNP